MTDFKNILLDQIQKKEAQVAVIGLGYVGLPLAVEFARAGFRSGYEPQLDLVAGLEQIEWSL